MGKEATSPARQNQLTSHSFKSQVPKGYTPPTSDLSCDPMTWEMSAWVRGTKGISYTGE